MQLDLSNEDLILLMNNKKLSFDDEMLNHILKLAASDAVKNGTKEGNLFINSCIINLDFEHIDNIKETLYDNGTREKKGDMIFAGYVSDSHVLVRKGDTVDQIIINYLSKHLDKFPRLKKSVDNNPEKWTEARIREALNDYMQDFRDDIMKDLGISDPTKLQSGQILELDDIKWEEHQPNWLNYNLTY